MNHKRIILIIIATYVVAMVAAYFGIDCFIKSKENRLRKEITDKVDGMFGDYPHGKFRGTTLVDVLYHGKNVDYERISIPDYVTQSFGWVHVMKNYNSNNLFAAPRFPSEEEWNAKYGKIRNLYRMKGDHKKDGWRMIRINNHWESDRSGDRVHGPQIEVEIIFPYAVGFVKQPYSENDYSFLVEYAIEDAFQFYSTNFQSPFLQEEYSDQYSNGRFERGCSQKIEEAIREADNEYFHLKQDKTNERWTSRTTPLFADFNDWDERTSPYEYDCIGNGNYQVFIGMSQPTTWSIYYWPEHPERIERKKLMLLWGIGLTILMLGAVIPLTIIHNKKKKIANEGLLDKLKRMCNPANFIKQYDKDKVEKANAIYQQLMSNNLDNEKLMELQAQAVAELGITLIDKNRLAKLKAKLNPQNYMKPYDAEKVSLANELYSRVNKDGLTYEEFVEIETSAKNL